MDRLQKILGEIISRHGTAICDDFDYFETLLRENCGDKYKREVFILVNALHQNIVFDLYRGYELNNGSIDENLLTDLGQRLYDNLGFDESLANWAVRSWALALAETSDVLGEAVDDDDADKLEFTEDFLKAYDLMENSDLCVFITGKAGTGKSTLLQYFQENSKKKLVILAPTGVAALNVGGATLHSFFRLPPRPISLDEIKTVSPHRRKIYKSLDTIVIDEVSMVRADMLDVIDRFMRLNGKNKFKPFGGVQMIFIGDLFQLPPVVSNDEESKLFSTGYKSPFFFSAKVFAEVKMEFVELTKVYRQKEQNFVNLLNSIRNNQAASSDIEQINQRYQPQFESSKLDKLDLSDYYITLTTTNKIASQINTAHLKKLSSKLYQFEGEINGKFEKGSLPTDLVLELKDGAQVMFVKNDGEGRWVNGTLGRIKKIHKKEIEVKTSDNRIYKVKPVKWEILLYKFDAQKETLETEVIGSFRQYPLRLAWGITIHKSQGKQFDNVIIDLGWGAFAHGQLYVALSRCKTLEGLILKSRVRPKDVIVDNRVIEFFSSGRQPQPPEILPMDELW